MKIRRGKSHCIADCIDCGEVWQNYKTAHKQAYRHAKKTGHEVFVAWRPTTNKSNRADRLSMAAILLLEKESNNGYWN